MRLVVFCVVAALLATTRARMNNDKTVNVFVVAHSHDDTGWLRTVDEYYDYEVEYIISGVVQELLANPKRRFIQVEIAFFRMWWEQQCEFIQEDVKKLVAEGRLRFILGGECMPDEAGTTVEALTSMISSGHAYIDSLFGPSAVPNISWHIDPFGHSASVAALWAHAGFKGHVMNRVDYRTLEAMKEQQRLEFVWEPLPGRKILAHVLDSHYCTPDGFDWEHGVTQELPEGDGPPVVIDRAPSSFTKSNVADVAHKFMLEVQNRSRYYATPNVLIPFGCDFNFQNARMKFFNMDKLIDYINAHPEVYHAHIQYSTLDDYFDALAPYADDLPTLHGDTDFFPYSDWPVPWIPEQKHEGNQAYWTGYFTSRPQQKGLGRLSEAAEYSAETLLTAVQLSGAASRDHDLNAAVQALNTVKIENGIFQHHDAVTGTEREHVYDDYQMRLEAALATSAKVMYDALHTDTPRSEDDVVRHVSVVNSLGWAREELVAIQVDSEDVQIIDANGTAPAQQITPTWPGGEALDGGHDKPSAPFTLTFVARVGPAETALYTLKIATDTVAKRVPATVVSSPAAFVLGHSNITLTPRGNQPPTLSLSDGTTLGFSLLAYRASENATQPSGAYILRPTEAPATPLCSHELNGTQVEGPLAFDVWLSCAEPAFHLRFRTAYADGLVELSHSIGPLPEATEVVLTLDTGVNNGDTFYTDTNAYLMMKRTRVSHREGDAEDSGVEMAGNMYPVNGAVVVVDQETSKGVAVAVGRPTAGSSLRSGHVDLLVHRRLAKDDYRGVREALDDKTVVNGRHVVDMTSATSHRHLSLALRHPLLASPAPSAHSPLRPLAASLPADVHLMTLAPLRVSGEELVVGLRLQHIRQEGEPGDTRPVGDVTVDLGQLLQQDVWVLSSVDETDLTLIRSLGRVKSEITLHPLEIRSFVLTLKKK